MQVKCRYCGADISDTDERCKNCGAVNDSLKRTANGAPKTIEELKDWYVAHNLPDENTTRFFIGKNVESRRAFGIYKSEVTGNYVVYKNKDNGARAIRYEGTDEAYAVNELYQRLKQEIQNQKGNKVGPGWASGKVRKSNNSSNWMLIHVALIFCTVPFIRVSTIAYLVLFFSLNPGIFIMMPILNKINDSAKEKKIDKYWHIISIAIYALILLTTLGINTYTHRNDAYYESNNVIYYHYGDDWYYYDNDSWSTYYGDTSNFNYLDDDYSSSYNTDDFKTSDYYSSGDSWGSSSSDSDWDSDSSWDSSDSWDSGGTDWSSDW